MAYSRALPRGTVMRRATLTRRDHHAGLVCLFVLFLLGGLLLATHIGQMTTEHTVGSALFAQLVGPHRAERLRQGYSASSGAAAPYCAPGQAPRFVNGFAALQARLGDQMGTPLECEHGDPDSGNVLQQTTTGLAVYDPRTNLASFTDGWRSSALTPRGLVNWEGGGALPTLLAEQ